MKKRKEYLTIFSVSLIFLFGPFFNKELHSSTNQRGITEKGLGIGLNLSGLHGTTVSQEASRKLGFTIGGFITYSLSNSFAIQPEIYYAMRGAKMKEHYYGATSISYSVNLSYLEIPILARLRFSTQGKIIPQVFGGPFFSITLSGKEKGDGWENNIQDLRGYDYGLVFGGGIIFPLGQRNLRVDIRYNVGLATIDANENPKFRESIKNNSFSILFGYNF